MLYNYCGQYCFVSDVAIGAPYEDGGEGVVYIYRGSNNGLVETPMQVHCLTPMEHFI